MALKKHIIIVAGGSGKRMQSNLPKQFHELNGMPLLMHSIKRFTAAIKDIDVIVVLADDQKKNWQALCEKHKFNISHRLVSGGKERYHSVKNALDLLSSDSIVGIHDGVRPLVSKDVIINTFQAAEEYKAAIPVIKVNESLRKIVGKDNVPVHRDDFRIVQTPQCFQSEIILKAYQQKYKPSFTDDASVVENSGHKIFLTKGNVENIKITTPKDMLFAEMLMRQ